MPPPAAKKEPLTPAQIDLLRRWIDQGAKFDVHWAYVKPVRPLVLQVKDPTWVHNAVDRFVAARHDALGLRRPSGQERMPIAGD